jgi:large subunit ribosomal protein L3
MLALLGKKLGQTRVYDKAGNIVPVTVVLAGPNRVVQVKTVETDGYKAVQLGFDDQKSEKRVTRPLAGHFKKNSVQLTKRLHEVRDFGKEVKAGDTVGPDIFAVGDFVDAIGYTKGRGFEGVVKRHRFRGGDMTHGAKGWHRRSGAIGQRLFPGTVMRGMKMPGHMGQVRRTTQNLEVVQVRPDENVILIKGAIPGSKGDYVVIRASKKKSKERMAAASAPKGKK